MRTHVDPHFERATEAEFLSGPETMDKVELIDGDVVRSPTPTFGHQLILMRLVYELGMWVKGRPVSIVQSPCDVRFGPGRILAAVGMAMR